MPTEHEMKEIWERLTNSEASIKSAHRRIDEVEDMQKSINDIAVSVGEIAVETKALRSDFNKVDNRICEIEKQPIKRYDTIVTAVITTLTGGIVGFLLNALLTM